MRPTARFLAYLGGNASPRWVTRASWSNDGGRVWQPLQVMGGQATCSTTSQVRWTATLQTRDMPFGMLEVNPFQSRMKIEQGMVYSPAEPPEWVPMGFYAVTSVSESTQDRRSYEITGESYEHYLIRSRIYLPRTLAKQRAKVALELLIHEVLPDARIDWHPDVDTNVTIPRSIITERWATIDGSADSPSIGQSLGARVHHGADGVWRVEPVTGLTDAPTWTATEGVGGVQIYSTNSLTNEGTYNVAVVVGTPSGGGQIGPCVAKDNDPTSMTYVGLSPDRGGYGEAAAPEYRTQFVSNKAQGNVVARARLSNYLGLRQKLGGEFRHNPLLRAGDVGQIETKAGPVKCIIDAVSFDLGSTPGNLSPEIRVGQVNAYGSVSEIVDDSQDRRYVAPGAV